MKIIVCAKRVVATDARIKVAADGKSIDTGGLQWITAPYDEMALAKAVALRDAAGEGSVTVVTIGPAEASKELRTMLAIGADDAVHLVHDGRLGAGATAKALAAAIRDREPDLVLCGKQATDEDDAAVGPMLAARLGLPCVAFTSDLEVRDGKAVAKREIDGQTETYEVDLPAVFTAQKGLAEPGRPSLKGIMAAKKKPLESTPLDPPADDETLRALEPPPARGETVSIEPTPEGMRTLLEALRNDKKVL